MNMHTTEIQNGRGTRRIPIPRLAGTLGLWAAAAIAGASVLQAGAGPADGGHGRAATQETTARPELELGRSDLHDYDPPAPGSYTLPIVKAAADGEVLDSEGRLRSLRTMLDGRVTILSFVYLRCASPNACPYATGVLRQIHEVTRKDPALARRLQLITLSFDPAHDTPQRMADYGALFRGKGGADWHFLTTRNERDLKPILKAYDQTVDRKANMDDPLGPYFHPVRVYLIDGHGRIRNIYSFGMLDPRMIVTDVRTVLQEPPTMAAGN
jgi:cytochrome oxidase Cu insertion factor (SCO1/SenC/PrrC family)